MVKKLLIYILISMLPLTAISQQDTIKLPVKIAKKVVIDLISGDSAKAMLKQREEQLRYTEEILILKDSIIGNYKSRNELYKDIVRNQEDKYNLQGGYLKTVEKENKKLKTKLTFTQIILVACTVAFGYLYAAK